MQKTIAEKLQIKPGGDLLVVGAESEQRALLDPLPEDTSVVETATGDVAVLFATDRTALDERLAYAIPALNDTRAVWIAYPKGNRTDINRDSIWRSGPKNSAGHSTPTSPSATPSRPCASSRWDSAASLAVATGPRAGLRRR